MNKRMGYFLGLVGLASGLAVPSLSASALTYQSNVGVRFAFNTKLEISLNSADLIIEDLAPGTAEDSNIITVNVRTNNKLGYTLTSTVGNTTYNNRNLTLKNGNKTFSSVDYGTAIASNTDLSDDTWAYSYSTNGGTDWLAGDASSPTRGYSGLSLYTDTTNTVTLRESPNPTSDEGDDTQFKIAARASSTQAAGEYNNVINFNVVAEPEPMTLAASYAAAGKSQTNGYYLLQDMTSEICDNTEVLDTDSQLQLLDTRDNKIYWATKLKDGHCWMTQNLDLDLGVATLSHNSTTLYHDDTDLGWGSDTATTSWTPDKATISWNGSTFSGWSNQYTQQYSADPGDYYYAGYDGTTLLTSTTVNYLTIAPNASGDIVDSNNIPYFSTDPSRVNGGTHEHVGNYYNWSAAVASNDTSSYTTSTYGDISGNPQNSICPAGWRLPTITSASPNYNSAGSKNEFARVAKLYAGYSGSTSLSSAGLEASLLFFARGGGVDGGSLVDSGNRALYWSSSVRDGSLAYRLAFNATYVNPQIYNYRSSGRSVRCLAR